MPPLTFFADLAVSSCLGRGRFLAAVRFFVLFGMAILLMLCRLWVSGIPQTIRLGQRFRMVVRLEIASKKRPGVYRFVFTRGFRIGSESLKREDYVVMGSRLRSRPWTSVSMRLT